MAMLSQDSIFLTERRSNSRILIDGAIAGAVGTLTMSILMSIGKRVGLMGELPPEKIAADALRNAGLRLTRTQQDAAAVVAHFGFGAVAGAIFCEAVNLTGRRSQALPLGVFYGTGIWAFSYFVPMPLLGIMPPPHRDQPGRAVTMVLAHWVYGATLGVLLRRRGT